MSQTRQYFLTFPVQSTARNKIEPSKINPGRIKNHIRCLTSSSGPPVYSNTDGPSREYISFKFILYIYIINPYYIFYIFVFARVSNLIGLDWVTPITWQRCYPISERIFKLFFYRIDLTDRSINLENTRQNQIYNLYFSSRGGVGGQK